MDIFKEDYGSFGSMHLAVPVKENASQHFKTISVLAGGR